MACALVKRHTSLCGKRKMMGFCFARNPSYIFTYRRAGRDQRRDVFGQQHRGRSFVEVYVSTLGGHFLQRSWKKDAGCGMRGAGWQKVVG